MRLGLPPQKKPIKIETVTENIPGTCAGSMRLELQLQFYLFRTVSGDSRKASINAFSVTTKMNTFETHERELGLNVSRIEL